MSVVSADLVRSPDEWEAPTAPAAGRAARFLAGNTHRCFFTAAILIGLTAGAGWGGYLLWRIGDAGSFTAVPVHQVNAHGHAQVFGWVGLFIIGFCYRILPRLWGEPLVRPFVVPIVFAGMTIGLLLSVVGEAAAGAWQGARAAALVGGTLEATAVAVFASQIIATFRRSGSPLAPWSAFVLAGVFWFVLMAVFSAWYTSATLAAGTRAELLAYVSTYQAVLRNVQIHGLALFMISGMSLRLLPELFGTPRTPDGRAWLGLGVLLAAAAVESLAFLAVRLTGRHAYAGLMYGGWVLFPVGVALIALPWRLWRPLPRSDRSAKFIRAAWAWLLISLSMMLLFPAYQRVSGLAFSHAYYGAIRHAVTVGFVSLIIMGMAGRVAPLLRGCASGHHLPSLWGPFLLINAGCFARVASQVSSDWHDAPFRIIGLSGVLEVTGLAWWGVHLIGLLYRRDVGLAGANLQPSTGPWAPQRESGDAAAVKAVAGQQKRSGETPSISRCRVLREGSRLRSERRNGKLR